MKDDIQKLLSLPPKGPLNGYFVLEIGGLISGPSATSELARKGAQVLKLELKGKGDPARAFLSKEIFTSFNASKASIALDKNNESDLHLYYELLHLADVIIDNRSPDAKQRDADLQHFLRHEKQHPVIFCSIVGYDSQNYRDRAALDVAVQAETGMAMVNAPSPDFPLKVGFAVIDIVTGIQAASAIKDHLIALSRGHQLSKDMNNVIFLEQSMAKTAALLLSGQYLNTYTQRKETYRDGNRDLWLAPFSFYKTKNGMVSIAIVGDPLFAVFCNKVLQQKELAEKYPTNKNRLDNIVAFEKELSEILSQKEAEEWIALCKDNGIVCTKVNTIMDMLKEPFAQKMFTLTQDGVTIMAHSSISSAFPDEIMHGSPKVDEHREAIRSLMKFKAQFSSFRSFTELSQFFQATYQPTSPAVLPGFNKKREEKASGNHTNDKADMKRALRTLTAKL